jgi:preprotein translocase subunit SecY
MMAVVVPSMAALKKEGESGRRKITQWTRYFTVVLAAFQGFAAAVGIPEPGRRHQSGHLHLPCLPAVLTLTTGTMFLMWLGEQITERGIGNGLVDDHPLGHHIGPARRDRRHARAGARRAK